MKITKSDIDSQTVSPQEYVEISQFLAREARLLDQNLLWEWYETLADDYKSEVPVRVTLARAEIIKDSLAEFKTGVNHANDTKGSTRIRIERLFSGYAWAEDPSSRTVRSIGSIEVSKSNNENEFDVSSALLLYRERGLEPDHQFISANRHDVIRSTSKGLELVRRTVYLAHTIVNTPNLGLFL
jgi:3-phenylpropionate/cinnamic acid dioxygenase small subunit